MGKKKDVRSDVSVGVKMTATERAKLTALAERTGLTVSGTIRALIVAGEATPVTSWVPTLAGGARGP